VLVDLQGVERITRSVALYSVIISLSLLTGSPFMGEKHLDELCLQSFIRLTRTTILNYSKTTMDKLLHTDDRHRKSVLMKASDLKPKRR